MKKFFELKRLVFALVLAVCAVVVAGCDDDDSPIASAAKSFEGSYTGTLKLTMPKAGYAETFENVTFAFVSNGDGTVNVTVPALNVKVDNAMMKMEMAFGSYQIPSVAVVGGAGVAVTGTEIGTQVAVNYEDVAVKYTRNGGAETTTTVSGSISAAVAKSQVALEYTFAPASMSNYGMSLSGAFTGKK